MKNKEIVWNSSYLNGLSWKKSTKDIKKILYKKSILELGVGNGKTLKPILSQNPKEVVAIDISEEAIKIASKSIKSDKVIFLNEDFLKFKTNKKFDVIVCYYFLNNFRLRERIDVVTKIKSLLKNNGTILFEDFAKGDFRQKGKILEKDTIQKQDGRICHFFEKNELIKLFRDFNNIKVEEKTFSPIRLNRDIKRKILKATIK